MAPGELVCSECGHHADRDARGWQGHIVEADEDDDTEEVVFFCPLCAAREFGKRVARPRDR